MEIHDCDGNKKTNSTLPPAASLEARIENKKCIFIYWSKAVHKILSNLFPFNYFFCFKSWFNYCFQACYKYRKQCKRKIKREKSTKSQRKHIQLLKMEALQWAIHGSTTAELNMTIVSLLTMAPGPQKTTHN